MTCCYINQLRSVSITLVYKLGFCVLLTSFCGSTTTSQRQTVNDAVDLFLEYSPAVDKRNEHEQVVEKDKTETDS